MSSEERRSLFKMSGLPEAFGTALLTATVVLALSPYLAGTKIGPFEIPTLDHLTAEEMKVFGPIILTVAVFAFLPVWRRRGPAGQITLKEGASASTSPKSSEDTLAPKGQESHDSGIPCIALNEQFEPVDGADSLRPIAVDMMQRVARRLVPHFEVRIATIDSARDEISRLENTSPRSDVENRELANLKTQLNHRLTRRKLFAEAIDLLLANDSIRHVMKVPFDDVALSASILGLRDRLLTENVPGRYGWYLMNPAYTPQVSLPITEAERQRMYRGKFIGDSRLRTLDQIEKEEAQFPLTWLDSDILLGKAVPAILVSVIESQGSESALAPGDRRFDFSTWQVHLKPKSLNQGH